MCHRDVICRGAGGFNFSRWRGWRLRCITASNGRMDEKGMSRIKRVLSMGPWFSAPRDLYFCTRFHVTLIHLSLWMYRFVCSRTDIYMYSVSVRACECMYALARTYISRRVLFDIIGGTTASSMVSEHSSIPRGISHLPRSTDALSSIWQIASPKCYILYCLTLFARLLFQSEEITRYRCA